MLSHPGPEGLFDNNCFCLFEGLFDKNRYFDVKAEYCKASPNDILGKYTVLIQAYHQYGMGSCPVLQFTKKGALDSQPQVIKFTSCFPMVGGSLWVLRLLPPLKLVTMI
jgi:hypothetical protein